MKQPNIAQASDTASLTLEHTFYCEVLDTLTAARIPFLVGGGYALGAYTGIARATKDLDLFILQTDVSATLDACSAAGFLTKLKFPHWLGKVSKDEFFVDIIFGSGNGLCTVDREWFQHAVPSTVCHRPVLLCPPEEMIWSKAFIMERDRFDGAEIAHILNAKGNELNWDRLLRRFHSHWRVLFSHLILCAYIFPSDASKVPDWLVDELVRRLRVEMNAPPATERWCHGTLLSWAQYLPDICERGYRDARHFPKGNLSQEQTKAITGIFQSDGQGADIHISN